MLGHLIRKEILDHLSGVRFLILAALGAVTIWFSLFSGYTYYRARLQDYRLAQTADQERIRQILTADEIQISETWMEVSAISYYIHKSPVPTSIFIRGLDPVQGRSGPVQSSENNRLKLSPASVEPLLKLFPPLDMGLVVQVILSLFVLLFTYDAVCGEKQAGTLRLTASFPVPRDRLLLGKFIGALFLMGAAFGLPLLLGFAVLLLMPDVQFTNAELYRLGLIAVTFALYLIALACAGLFASSLTHHPAVAFVILLGFWVATVIVLPRLSLIVSGAVQPAPSVHEYQAEMARISKEGNEKRREFIQTWSDAHSEPGNEWWQTPEGREEHERIFDQARTVAGQYTGPRLARLEEAFRNRYNARLNLSVALSRLSPAFALKNAVLRLAGTGTERQQRFETAASELRGRNYAWYRETKNRDRFRMANPQKYGSYEWDASDMPRFAYRETWPGEDIRTALTDIGVLALWSLVFFAGAHLALLRYDLR